MIDRDKEIMATVLMYTYMKSIGDALYGMYFSKLYNDVKSREVVKRIAQKCFGVEIRTGAISLFFGDFNRLLENMVYKSGIWEAVQNES